MSDTFNNSNTRAVAVIGMAGRFPGASSVREYWNNLCKGVECLTTATEEDLIEAGVDAAQRHDPSYVPRSGSIADADLFDASFFGFGAREAEIIDPQQRIFLECAWEAFEDAGYDPTRMTHPVGVFAGSGMNTYSLLSLFPNKEIMASVGSYQIMLGNDKDFLSTRVSYKLNLKGPSVNVQTACSTSLVAVQMAYESILRGECDMALAGGVSILFPQKTGYVYTPGMILSPDGHCRAFDAKSAGTVPGSGCGVVLLKPLNQAVKDGDRIYAVIRGAAINNDGSAKVGYSAPSIEGQSRVISQSMAMAGFSPDTVQFIEAHGTGTEVGDPIEIAALTQSFQRGTDKLSFCAIGSVKTNIGHLDTAAGIAGFIKTALSIYYRTLPPSLHFEKPNPLIPFDESPFFVNTSLREFPAALPLRAGVSSFGIGGTNAHVSLEEAPRVLQQDSELPQLIVLSAKSEHSLRSHAARLLSFLDEEPDTQLSAIAYTLQDGRKAFPYRHAFVAASMQEVKASLAAIDTTQPPVTAASKTAFLFSGQGSQYLRMGEEMSRFQPVFRQTLDQCALILQPLLNQDIRELLYPAPQNVEHAERLLHETWITQPVLFAVEYALAKTWLSLGIQPAAMLGHSVGEYVAACIAQVFSLEDALATLVIRGRLIQSTEPGAMLAVSLSDDQCASLLNDELSLAAINSPEQCVLSGSISAISAVESVLKDRGVQTKRLPTSRGFHSHLLAPVLDTFQQQFENVSLHTPKIPFLSNLTGTWITPEQATNSAYWVDHMRACVQFSKGLLALTSIPNCTLLETGPGSTLLTLSRQHPNVSERHALIGSLPHQHAKQSDYSFWLNSLGKLWISGVEPLWNSLHADSHRVSLPTYPFERQRYWIKPSSNISPSSPQALNKDLEKQPDIANWFYIPTWTQTVPQLLKANKPLEANQVSLLFEDGSQPLQPHLFSDNTLTVRTIRVQKGLQSRPLSDDLFELNSGERAGWDILLQHLLSAGVWPAKILYAWPMALSPEKRSDANLQEWFLDLMFLTQALGAVGSGRKVEINIVATSSCSIAGETITNLAAAALPIVARCISLENPNLYCRLIDVEPNNLSALVHELSSETSGEHIAYRGTKRWERAYESIRVHDSAPQIHLIDHGVYVITGGLGGLGLTFAQYFAQSAHAHVVLTSRSPFPAHAEWEQLLNQDATTPQIKQRIRGLNAIVQAGGTVEVVHVDSTDRDRMHAVLTDIEVRHGAVHGIVHAAGLPSMRIMQTKSAVEVNETLAPKVAGVRWIEDYLEHHTPDFVLLCSSISAVAPTPGLSDYAAANAYLDAFANALDKPGARTKVISTNWDTWSEVGMAVNRLAELHSERNNQFMSHAITSAEGVAALKRIFSCPLSQTVVSTRNFDALLTNTAELLHQARTDSLLQASTKQDLHQRPNLSQPYISPETSAEQAIAEIWQELLGIEQIGRNDNFFELGGHSLLGTQVIARVRNRFGIDLPLRTIFEASTPAELATILGTIPWAAGTNTATPLMSFEREEFEL